MSVGLHRQTKCASQAEICKFDVSIFVNQQILRLQISVHDSMRVAIGCGLENLVCETLDFMGWQRATYLPHVLLEIVLTILEDQVQLIL
jgi:hypothetical protein